MAGIRIKVVDVKAKSLLKAAVLWIYDDPSQESDVSIVNLKNLFEEEVLKDVTEFDPKSLPKSVSEASIILNEKSTSENGQRKELQVFINAKF